MVEMLDYLKERGAARREIRTPNLDKLSPKKRERLEIRDYDYDTGDSATWHANVPLFELFTHLPIASRIEPHYMMWRKMWMIMAALFTFLGTYAGLATIIGPVHPAFPSVVVAMIGGFIGWWNGASWCPTPPFWVARRLWVDGVPHIQPIVHTLLRGEMPIDDLMLARLNKNGNKNGNKEQADNIEGPPMIGGASAWKPLQVAGFDPLPEGVFVPVVYRSTTLFQDLQMVEERLDMKMPVDRSQLVKLGGIVLFGGILVVGLIFTLAVTSN